MKGILKNLQALRAYAAGSVLLVHLLPLFHVPVLFGLYGVDLFFVLSGFLMAMIMLNDPTAFLARRLIRIIPLYWLCTLGVYILALFNPQLLHTTQANMGNFIKSLLFVPYKKEGGVMQPMLFLGWTLNYEMYFYLICSLALWLRPARPILWASLGVLVLPTLSRAFYLRSDLVRYYANPIVLEFILGMIVYQLFSRRSAQSTWRWWEIWVLIPCLVALPCIEAVAGIRHRELLLGLPSAGIVLAAARLELKGLTIRSRVILLVGNASYALYLTHPYILQSAEKILHCGRWTSFLARLVSGISLTVAAVTFACVFHLFVEVPLIQRLKALLRPGNSPEGLEQTREGRLASS